MGMRIATWNVNGLRSAAKKGVRTHLDAIVPDVLLLQEIRVTPDAAPEGWGPDAHERVHWNPAQKAGYAGTLVSSRHAMKVEGVGLAQGRAGDDPEGRLVLARVGPMRVASVYLPSGSSGEHRQVEKEKWMAEFIRWAEPLARSRVPCVLGGDFNIARTEKDIFHAKSNEKNSGFLPHERAWMEELLGSGWHDLTREHAGDVHGPYSWWSNRGGARQLDRGWRIDYLLANKAARKAFAGVRTEREMGLAISDHAPVIAEFDLDV
ncbi:MAG: exodeoxyribonuclease III [Phycisphaerales bacterium]|jgi:exodeoxyribonuclease-3|nr:exodeoxyribonuclease III [Phycisphaerales bacterium]